MTRDQTLDSTRDASRPHLPDFLVIGAPKAGTSALHEALRAHPQVHVPSGARPYEKEPKYFMCEDAPPPAYCGPGDAHSQQEWVWRRRDYEALFAAAPEGTLRGESTPFYLWSKGAKRRIAEQLPDVKLIAIVRDPIDRAYSNWMHLWVDGLEPEADFLMAFAAEAERVDRGYAPFWRYGDLGRYGEQLRDLYSLVDPQRVLVLRFASLIDEPAATLDAVCRHLGIETGLISTVPANNTRTFAEPGLLTSALGTVIRAGAAAGAYAPPQVWRRASRPLIGYRQRGDVPRPKLTPACRERLLDYFERDIRLLESLTGLDLEGWRSTADRGSYLERSRTVEPAP